MKQTVEEAVANHRKLWNGIIEELETNGIGNRSAYGIKDAVRRKLFPELNNEVVHENCFLCDFVIEEYGREGHEATKDCMKCPMVKWVPFGCLGYRYGIFHNACTDKDVEKAIKYAKEILRLRVVNDMYKESPCYKN